MGTQLINYPEQINYFAYPYISGLDINYTTSGSLSVLSGGAYVPGLNKVVFVTGTLTQSIPIVSTNTSGSWQNIYLGENNGVPFIQVTGTAPSTPYSGVARSKTGDTTLRYLGSVYCDTGGYLYRFNSSVYGNVWRINWVENVSVFPFQFANVSGTVTAATVINVPWLVPPTSGLVIEMVIQNVHALVAGGDSVVSVSDNSGIALPSLGAQNVFAENLTRMNNGLAGSANVQIAASPVKITFNQLLYTHTNIAGTNGAFFRARGVHIQR